MQGNDSHVLRKLLVIFGVCMTLLTSGCTFSDEAGEEQLEASAVEGCATDVTPPAPRSWPLPGARKVLPPSDGAYAGLYAAPPASEVYREFVGNTGTIPPIVFIFHEWVIDEDMGRDDARMLTLHDRRGEGDLLAPLQLAERLSRDGAVLAVAWALVCCDVGSPYFLFGLERPWNIFSRVLSGEFDNHIRKVARQVKAFGHPIMLSLTGEFSGQGLFLFGRSGTEWMTDVENICNEYGDPTWPDGPERIRDSYRHVIDIFRDEDVRNVTWFMYAVTNYVSDDPIDDVWGHPKYYYPGDAYIDWVGQSAYFTDAHTARQDDDEDTRDFRGSLEAGYEAWGDTTNRPIFIPEFALTGDGRSSRARLLQEAFEVLVPAFPRVKALTFADSDLFAEYFEVPRFGKFPDEIEAWRKSVGNNPYYKASLRIGAR